MVRLFIASLISIIISTPLIAGGHKYIAYPVIFVHGFNADMGSWNTTKSQLQNLYINKYGYVYQAINPKYFPDMNYGKDKLGEFSKNGDCTKIAVNTDPQKLDLSTVIYNAIGSAFYESGHPYESGKELVPPEEMKVILVCHSFGGIVTRSLLKQNEIINQNIKDKDGYALPINFFKSHIANVIFIGVPHAGSPLASELILLNKMKIEVEKAMTAESMYSLTTYLYSTLSNKLASLNNLKRLTQMYAYYSSIIAFLQAVDRVGIDFDGYAENQLQLTQDVSLSQTFYGFSQWSNLTIEVVSQGNKTFLGQAQNNLAVPNKYVSLYGNMYGNPISGIDSLYRLSLLFNTATGTLFTFPPNERLIDIYCEGDSVVSKQSQIYLGNLKSYSELSGVSHTQETQQYEAIKSALCEDAPILNVQEPLPGKVYITKVYTKGKLRDYLPLSNCIDVNITNSTDGDAWTQKIANFINYKPISLNPDYEEINDNYQALFKAVIDLFPNKSPKYDDVFELKYIPYNPANIKGAEQGINFTYACLVSTATTPAKNEQNVPLDKEVKIVFKEKIRRETFTPQNISFTDNNMPIFYDIMWIDEKTVKLIPFFPLSPDTPYTITLTGDKPNTYDIDYPTTTIEGIQYYLSDSSVSDDNADKHGFDPEEKIPCG